MRAVRELRPPGVYPAAEELRSKPLTVSDTRITGFVGLAARGPMNEPRLVGGWNEFLDVYGYSKDSYLAHAVEGFFLNGGRSCYIVRVAHNAKPGRRPGPEHAACAERVLKDGWDKPSLSVRALNEGQWGNNIWVRAQQNTAAKTLLTLDLDVGIGEARINSAKGFERGALVRIYDRDNSDYIILTEVEDRIIRWNSSTPVVRRYRAASPTFLEVHEFELFAALRDQDEKFLESADLAAVAPLRRSCRQRRVAADSRRESAFHFAFAQEPADGGAGGEVGRRPRRCPGCDGRRFHRSRSRAGRPTRADGAGQRRSGGVVGGSRRDDGVPPYAARGRRFAPAAGSGRHDHHGGEPQGSVRDPRLAADQRPRRGAQVAAPVQLVVRGHVPPSGSRPRAEA